MALPSRIFFGNIITQQAIRRGSLFIVKNLVQKINSFIEDYNKTAKQFA